MSIRTMERRKQGVLKLRTCTHAGVPSIAHVLYKLLKLYLLLRLVSNYGFC